MIQLKGLVKTYDVMPVLRGVDLHVQAGEFVTLVGANGAGKSTLLRIVATLSKPTAGEVLIGGWHLPKQAHKVRRHIGLISHQPLLYGDLTAKENLLFFAKLYGLPQPEKLVDEALRLVGLAVRQRDAVRTFSRGMWQRLAIARATLHDPDILLLDEPYTGLDQAASATLTGLLQGEKEKGKTILMITHDFARGFDLCDRLAILNRGRIQQMVDRRHVTQTEFLNLYQDVTCI